MISCKKNFFLKFPEGQGLQQSSPNVVSCLCFDLGMTQVQVSGHKAAAAAQEQTAAAVRRVKLGQVITRVFSKWKFL